MGEFMQNSENGIRINKFLSEAGVCSRREADREIEAGNVRIGERVAVTGDRVMPEDQVFFRERPVKKEEEMILLVVNKPAGIVCTAEKREKNNMLILYIIRSGSIRSAVWTRIPKGSYS